MNSKQEFVCVCVRACDIIALPISGRRRVGANDEEYPEFQGKLRYANFPSYDVVPSRHEFLNVRYVC